MNDLTQDRKDGKLKEGLYYVQFPRGDVLRCKLSEVDKFFSTDIKILAEVPDYNLWKNLWNIADMEHKANNKLLEDVERLEKENKELKRKIEKAKQSFKYIKESVKCSCLFCEVCGNEISCNGCEDGCIAEKMIEELDE